MNYVRCLHNETLYADDGAETYAPFLEIGHVYKLATPEPNDGDQLRVIDGEGEDYLYPQHYFERYVPDQAEKLQTETVTLHLSPYLKNILRAEAIAAKTSVGGLLRQWADERLDLPEN